MTEGFIEAMLVMGVLVIYITCQIVCVLIVAWRARKSHNADTL